MYLNKILPIFLSPIVVTALLVLASILWRRRWLALVGVALLLLGSLPGVAERVLVLAQGDVVRPAVADVPMVDTVVVLAGALGYAPGSRGAAADYGAAVDRLLAGIEIVRAGRAEKVIFSSGVGTPPGQRTEGEWARYWATSMGVAEERIVLSPPATNTADEARLIRPLLTGDRPRIMLVTSANHMPRATLIFEDVGFEVVPFRVDLGISVGTNATFADRWLLPDARALVMTDTAVRELIGQAYYSLKFLIS